LHMKFARFIKTEGPCLEALIEVEGQPLRVMDEFSVDEGTVPKPGEEIEFEFAPSVSRHESWDEIFSGNPDQMIGLENIESWCYHAYGQIVSIGPVKVNCGLFTVEDVIHTNDPGVVGQYVRFTISCLGGYAHAI
jgi:hypothetical protein